MLLLKILAYAFVAIVIVMILGDAMRRLIGSLDDDDRALLFGKSPNESVDAAINRAVTETRDRTVRKRS